MDIYKEMELLNCKSIVSNNTYNKKLLTGTCFKTNRFILPVVALLNSVVGFIYRNSIFLIF